MRENKPSTLPDSADNAPDLSTPEWCEKFARAKVQRGRPRSRTTKVSTTIRLDGDILAYFRNGGDGWQTRINETLRAAMRPEIKKVEPSRARPNRKRA